MSRAGELEAIKARLAAATPGPWHQSDHCFRANAPGSDIGASNGANIALVHHEPIDRDARETVANAALIANAPADLATLVAEVESLQLANEQYVVQRDFWTQESDRLINQRDRLEARVEELDGALRRLYKHTAEYITINHLGDVHHNQVMKDARAALQSSAREEKP